MSAYIFETVSVGVSVSSAMLLTTSSTLGSGWDMELSGANGWTGGIAGNGRTTGVSLEDAIGRDAN
ncbi:hypothetical protein GCM10011400_67870 [Paraburkholderia caffeinilytica]|uniref:Uncharacterized protein n=1 Tax=Paraburkholderia caffeinilytica TaxID=1761016 RepID=A0ABQ1NCY2_9BURK|nr:hypothetical protein GCM10011400_67870 [Paraburkholderia caffeinilytica]